MSTGLVRVTVVQGFGLFVGGVLRQGGETVEVDPETARKWTGLGWCTRADDKPDDTKPTGKPKPTRGTGRR